MKIKIIIANRYQMMFMQRALSGYAGQRNLGMFYDIRGVMVRALESIRSCTLCFIGQQFISAMTRRVHMICATHIRILISRWKIWDWSWLHLSNQLCIQKF